MLSKLLMPFHKSALRRAVRCHKTQPSAASTVRLAKALVKTGRPDEAYSLITSGRRLFPDDKLIRSRYEAVRTSYAKSLLSKAMLELKRDKSLERFILAVDLLRALGQTEKALALVARIRDQFPDSWAIEFAVGQIYFSRFRDAHHPADLTDSLRHLRLARALSSKNYKILFFLALICTHAGLLDEARECCDEILQSLPADPKALSLRAQIESSAAVREELSTAAPRRAEGSPSVPCVDGDTVESAAIAFADRLSSSNEVLGVFAFDDKGKLLVERSKQSPTFQLGECAEVIWKMVSTSRSDASHIGVGCLQSCLLSGDDWQVAIRIGDGFHVAAFAGGGILTGLLDEIAAQPAASAG